jgi:hypothetical protein
MLPFFKATDLVIGSPIDRQDMPYFWDEVVIAEVEGQGIYLRKLLKGSQPGVFTLVPLNMQEQGSPNFHDVRLTNAYRIVSHRRILGGLRGEDRRALA